MLMHKSRHELMKRVSRIEKRLVILVAIFLPGIAFAQPVPIPNPGSSPTSADCTNDVWHHLEACGWAGPANTGYPAGTALKTTMGRTITVNDTVIDGEKIIGALRIAAKNVTIKNSWIISDFSNPGTGWIIRNFSSLGAGRLLSRTGVITIEPGASATIWRCTLDGSNATHAGIWHSGTSLSAIANNIFQVNDGIFSWPDGSNPTAGWNITVQDNYFHDFTSLVANGHIDGYQTEGSSHGIIRHNTFHITQSQNAAVSIWNSRHDSDDFLIDNNLAAGSGFLMYAEDVHSSEKSPGGGHSVTNVVHTNNRFSTALYPCAGYWGVWYPRGAPTDGWHRSGNVILETGENVDFSNPHVNGRRCD
jgi:hypothetical protein